ncbi:MAG: SprB repeat-containing protein, partial [Flavobacteriales bacterium]|nr:SprB repeat-containing protein [Flavobacteriales bacterium]
MKRPGILLKLLLVLTVLGLVHPSFAQTKYWTGGNGLWDDGAKWSSVPGGAGGAGVPRVNEDVVIASSAPITITFRDPAWCRGLRIHANSARVRMNGPATSEVNITGAWQLAGDVQWNATGVVRLGVRREGVELDPRGTVIAGDVVLDGGGTWSLISDLNVAGDLRFAQGTFISNGNGISARNMRVEGRARGAFMAGSAVIQLQQQPDLGALRNVVQPGSSTLVVAGSMVPWGHVQEIQGDRDINVCGTNPGQTPFTVNAQLTTNYNGFGVRCRGNCNATVTVSVTGGSGNFTYQWLNGGPPTATWTTACGGPQLVIVTDVGQGISCPAQVNVTEPAPVGVIFFGQGTPPTCAGVCDGTRTALGIGGVGPHTYDWNNGAGTNSSFNALCAGANTLRITDLNNCTFDTTFIFNLSPILPNLSFTDAGCFGECNGEATVAPTGGTGQIGAVWSPAPPVGQGTFTPSAVCAGDYNVTLT